MSRVNFPEKNLLLSYYLNEISYLCNEIVQLTNEIQHITNLHKPGMPGVISFPHQQNKIFFVNYEVFLKLANIQIHASNIKKIIFPTNRKNNEAKYKYDYRIKRTNEIQSYFDVSKIIEIRNSGVRNTLEHYEERLDLLSLELYNGTISSEYDIIASNLVLSSKDALIGKPYFLKSYIMDSMTYYNTHKQSDILAIYNEANYLIEQLKEVTGTTPISGGVIPIPPRNNS